MTESILRDLDRQHDEEAAEEARDQRIADLMPPIIARLMCEPEFCASAASELFGDPVESLMQSAGRFYARFNDANTNGGMAQAGHDLWRDLKPYMMDAARDAAETEAAAEVDRLDSLDRDDAAEARAQP